MSETLYFDPRYQNASGVQHTMAAGTNETAIIRLTASGAVDENDTLTVQGNVDDYDGSILEVQQGGNTLFTTDTTPVEAYIDQAGWFSLHLTANGSSEIDLISGANPGAGASHVLSGIAVIKD